MNIFNQQNVGLLLDWWSPKLDTISASYPTILLVSQMPTKQHIAVVGEDLQLEYLT